MPGFAGFCENVSAAPAVQFPSSNCGFSPSLFGSRQSDRVISSIQITFPLEALASVDPRHYIDDSGLCLSLSKVGLACLSSSPCVLKFSNFLLRVEGPTNEAFETYGNSLWHVFIVVTTVGFGDIYAESDEGRTLTVICAITGLVLATFFLTGVLESLNLDGLEQAATKNAAEKKTGDKIKIAAVSTISTAYKVYRMRVATKKAKKAGNAGRTAQDLKRVEKDFHSSTRKFINYKKKLGVATDMVPTDEKKEVESMGLMVSPFCIAFFGFVFYNNVLYANESAISGHENKRQV